MTGDDAQNNDDEEREEGTHEGGVDLGFRFPVEKTQYAGQEQLVEAFDGPANSPQGDTHGSKHESASDEVAPEELTGAGQKTIEQERRPPLALIDRFGLPLANLDAIGRDPDAAVPLGRTSAAQSVHYWRIGSE
jgi:hypothetical protein